MSKTKKPHNFDNFEDDEYYSPKKSNKSHYEHKKELRKIKALKTGNIQDYLELEDD